LRSKEFTKERIIKAAAKAFFEEGLDKTSMDEIAEAAGVSKGSLYNYFKNKDDLLTESISYVAKERIKSLKQLVKSIDSPLMKLITVLRANDAMAKRDPELFLMNYSLILSTHENIRKKVASEFFRSYIALVEKILKEAMRKKEIRKCNSEIIAYALVLTSDMVNILEFTDKSIVQTKHSVRELIKLLVKKHVR
jgi:AcrR family transcriptional regulator